MSTHAFTPSQKLALLMVRRMDRDSVSWKVSEAMRAMGIGFTPADMHMIAAEGLVRREGSRHVILPRGVAHAQIIAHDLARAYGIHHVSRRNGAGNMGPSVSCTCGWSSHASNNDSANGRLGAAAQHHLRMVAERKWPPPSIDDLISFLPDAGATRPPATRGAACQPQVAPHLLSEVGHA